VQSKKDFLWVIHDKMDHFKTDLPRLQVKNKMVSRLGQLLMTLTGMIAHGHGDEPYIQYFNELLSNDHYFTIGLLLCLFHSLERKPVRQSQVLFEFELKMHSSKKFYNEVSIV
jgi:hypothetical protein